MQAPSFASSPAGQRQVEASFFLVDSSKLSFLALCSCGALLLIEYCDFGILLPSKLMQASFSISKPEEPTLVDASLSFSPVESGIPSSSSVPRPPSKVSGFDILLFKVHGNFFSAAITPLLLAQRLYAAFRRCMSQTYPTYSRVSSTSIWIASEPSAKRLTIPPFPLLGWESPVSR